MQLLVIRHAIAEEREHFAATGANDDARPLTSFGRRRMKRNADGLRRVAPAIVRLAASPLVRAQQTAEIVVRRFGLDGFDTVDALRPGASMSSFASWLATHLADETIAVVGHEPHLGTLITWLLSAVEEPRVSLRKGGAALLDVDGEPKGGCATMSWLLTPSHLRSLGE